MASNMDLIHLLGIICTLLMATVVFFLKKTYDRLGDLEKTIVRIELHVANHLPGIENDIESLKEYRSESQLDIRSLFRKIEEKPKRHS